MARVLWLTRQNPTFGSEEGSESAGMQSNRPEVRKGCASAGAVKEADCRGMGRGGWDCAGASEKGDRVCGAQATEQKREGKQRRVRRQNEGKRVRKPKVPGF